MRTSQYFCVLLFFAVLVSGCQEGPGEEKTKIGDIIPKDRLLEDKAAIGLYLYVFELDRDKYPAVLDVLYDINDLPVEYVNLGSFAGNGLVSCGGDIETWAKMA
ncbi:MAG: hypothetical protein PHQ00_06160, partial [Phycisphaerae bacterium]|nr:hypothetical protein [Phycisphaerae bacterium]